MIQITFPDSAVKSFDNPPTGLDVAKSISEGFARNCVAMRINDQLLDLGLTIQEDASIGFVTTNDDEGLEILRHSSAHVMAEAVLNLYPDAKLTIGPVVEDGFYYDIDMAPISEEDMGKVEAEMKKIVKAKASFERSVVSKQEALELFKDNPFKVELINELDDQEISFLRYFNVFRIIKKLIKLKYFLVKCQVKNRNVRKFTRCFICAYTIMFSRIYCLSMYTPLP